MPKHSHLSLDDRIEIQECLSKGMSFKAVAKRIQKDQTTVSKEVKKHITVVKADGTKSPCSILLKSPFVCNGCTRKRTNCGFDKHYYYARHAYKDYQATLHGSREGIALDKESFWEVDKIISNGLKQGQRLYHIIKTHNLGVSEATVYRHVKRGYRTDRLTQGCQVQTKKGQEARIRTEET